MTIEQPVARCARCNRAAFDRRYIDKRCGFLQPDGSRCEGLFVTITEQRMHETLTSNPLAFRPGKLRILCSCGETSLAGPPVKRCIACQGADEIERLTAERDEARAVYRTFKGHVYVPNAEYAALVAERDRLLAQCYKDADTALDNARLRAALERIANGRGHNWYYESTKALAGAAVETSEARPTFDPVLALNIRNELAAGFHMDNCKLKYGGSKCDCGYSNFGHSENGSA